MGLFGKLFDKKECSICGGEIGLLGNRKLEDGNLCKDCAKKLSPWFDDRRHSTVDQIAAQLDYREANQDKVAAFRTTRTLGEGTKVLLDEDAGVFMVASTRNFAEENPDVLAFSDVTGCVLDIDEDTTEIMRETPDGEEVSYNPPRYEYSYDFDAEITVNNPYFDDIRFRINRDTLNLETVSRRPVFSSSMFQTGFDPTLYPEYRQYRKECDELEELFRAGMQGMLLNGYAAPANTQDLAQELLARIPNAKMEELDDLSKRASDITILNRPDYKEIQEKILKAVCDRAQELHAMRTGNQTAAAAAAVPQASAGPKFCPNCGAPADGGKFCQSCGSKLA